MTHWSWAGKAQPARGPWQSPSAPRGLLQPRVGISQPVPLPGFSTGGWDTDCHAGWELVAVRALPMAGKDSRAEDRIFLLHRGTVRGASPCGEESLSLLFLSRATLSLPEQKCKHYPNFPKEEAVWGRRAAPTSEPQRQKRVADLIAAQPHSLVQRDFGGFLLLTWRASSIKTVLRCFDTFSAFAKQYLQLGHQNSSESSATRKSSGNLCFRST